MIPALDQWGPFRPDIDPAERLARLRSLRAITRLCCGPRGERLANELNRAERDASRLPFALAALDHLAPLDRRQVLASYAQLHRHAA